MISPKINNKTYHTQQQHRYQITYQRRINKKHHNKKHNSNKKYKKNNNKYKKLNQTTNTEKYKPRQEIQEKQQQIQKTQLVITEKYVEQLQYGENNYRTIHNNQQKQNYKKKKLLSQSKESLIWWQSPVDGEKHPKWEKNPNELYNLITQEEKEEGYETPLLKDSERRRQSLLRRRATDPSFLEHSNTYK